MSTTISSQMSIEMSQLKQDNPPCCICYVQKPNKSIVEYKCGQCQEGIVCLDCAAKLWKTNSKNKCPVCNFSPTPPDTWYKSYDVEMGYIRPPSIDENESVNNDEDNEEHYERGRLSKYQIILLASFITIFAAFIAFIVGTIIKTIEGICTWNCDNEPLIWTITGSIAFGFIALPVIALCILFAMFIVGMICEGIKYCTMKVYDRVNHYAINNGLTVRELCSNFISHKVKSLGLFTIFIIASFCTGILFKLFTGLCLWNCKDETVFYTIFTTTMVGIPILIIGSLFIIIVFSCSAFCIIVCLDLGNINR